MPDVDPVAARLGQVQAPDAVRADVWDAFHQAPTAADFATRIKTLPIPDAVKADLWDLKQAAAPPTFQSTNEKDAAGAALVRPDTVTRAKQWTAADYVVASIPGLGLYADQVSEHPATWLKDKIDEWGKAGPHRVVEGIQKLAAGEYSKGTHDVAMGSAVTAAPMFAPGLIDAVALAPIATATSVAGGTGAALVAEPVAKDVARGFGATEDQAQLVGDAAMVASSWAGSKVTPRQAVAAYEAVRHPWMTVGRGVGTAAEAAVSAYQARQAARQAAAEASAAGPPAAEAVAAPTPAVPPVTSRPQTAQDAVVARPITEARATPAPAPVEPPVQTPVVAPAAVPRPPTPSVRASGRWGPGESQNALRQAADQAGYPISEGEVKTAWPSVQAAGADGGPAVAALHVERMQARAAPGAAAAPRPAVAAAVEPAPVVPVAPVSAAEAPAAVVPVAAAPTATAPSTRPIMSAQMALNEVGLAARRLQVPMTLDEARAAAEFIRQGSTPPRAIQQWMDAGRPALEAPPVPQGPVRVPGPRDSIMSPTLAGSEVALVARRLQIPLTPAQVDEAAAFVLNEGLTPKAAIARWMETAGAPAAAAAVPSVSRPAPSREELAADLAARLGTPSPAASEEAIDARWRRGELKSPSGPTARRMRAEADARLVTEPAAPAAGTAEAAAPVVAADTPPTKPRLVRTPKPTPAPASAQVPAAGAETVTGATADAPADAAQTVTQQIERVIDTHGLKSGAAVQARVMETLRAELAAAKKAAGFSEVTYQPRGSTGGDILVDGRSMASHDKHGVLEFSKYLPNSELAGKKLYKLESNGTQGQWIREATERVATAISDAKGAGQLVVRVPGDGTFTIARNPLAIERVLLRIQKGGASPWKGLGQ